MTPTQQAAGALAHSLLDTGPEGSSWADVCLALYLAGDAIRSSGHLTDAQLRSLLEPTARRFLNAADDTVSPGDTGWTLPAWAATYPPAEAAGHAA